MKETLHNVENKLPRNYINLLYALAVHSKKLCDCPSQVILVAIGNETTLKSFQLLLISQRCSTFPIQVIKTH
ncbi:hypothetical protein NQ317_017434 [Molorchus minor]|uniref:Uncharacterized protein n=1 Tax=Molorchus minor TaxID=1323400 RepID=A0ABQ9JAX0_9CUCU|nr:hypothetical protein NQ317_017434 [Molorchus minor]